MKKDEKMLLIRLVKDWLGHSGVEMRSCPLGVLGAVLKEGQQQVSICQAGLLLDQLLGSYLTLSGALEVIAELRNTNGKARFEAIICGFHPAFGVLERFGTLKVSKINRIIIDKRNFSVIFIIIYLVRLGTRQA